MDDKAECPICGTIADAFEPHGLVRVQPDRRCPGCTSLERHRAMWLLLRRRTRLLDGEPTRLLHMAPEPAVARPLKALPNVEYLSGDLAPGKAMRVLDLTDLDLPTDSLDAVWASHILEHIPDDLAAMRELRRVLRPGGWALLVVPMFRDKTDEDPTVVDPADRAKRFGQENHVRMYGWDGVFEERLRTAGWEVEVDDTVALLEPATARRYRVRSDEPIHWCT